jgi:beta-ribofuranosylaminobenzene 5'-phosphate synthase
MFNECSAIRIRTPTRLHFSLIDLNGELGRVDGGLGVAIDKPNWVITIRRDSEWNAPSEISEIIENLKNRINIKGKYKIELESSVPAHVGLGSQTQLTLAIAHGLAILEDQKYTIPELASLVERGGTSGIGVAGYEQGGFILDAGHSRNEKSDFLPSHFSSAKPALVLSRLEVPEDWYFVVAIPDIGKGLHGNEEVRIFDEYCPIPREDVEKISHIILFQMLPALKENDIEQFGVGLTSLQNIGFKGIENQLQDEIVTKLQSFYLKNGATGTGLSSFGPATFCLIKSESAAKELKNQTKKFLEQSGHTGTVFFSRVDNSGAKIEKI